MERRLTTIFYADGAGFSRLMERDEASVFRRLKNARRIMEELFARHHGRQVNSWGDAVIAEFASVVEAVRCAVEIQEALGRAPDSDAPTSADRMRFRIGVNLGDVLVDGDDLYGDGVNVAARLQDLAEPGGVAISATVHELVRKQMSVEFRHMGPQAVKSMEERVDAWSVRIPEGYDPDAPGPMASPVAAEPEPRDPLRRAVRKAENALSWVEAQPRRIRVAAGMIAMFFTINLLFGGIANPWFLFPSAPFVVTIMLHRRREAAAARTRPDR